MELIIKGDPAEISAFLTHARGIISNEPSQEQANPPPFSSAEIPNVKCIVDTKAISELTGLTRK